MKAFFKNVLYSGIQDRLGPDEQVKLLFINTIILFGLVVLGFFGLRDLASGHTLLGAVTLGISLIVVILFFAIRVTKGFQIGAIFLPSLMFAFYTYLTASGGASSTGVLWMETYPVIAVFLVGPVWGSLFSVAFLISQSILLFVPGLSPILGMDIEFKFRLLGAYIILFAFSLAFETIRLRILKELAAVKVQTDGILTNVSEGIFLLGPDLTIGDQHSKTLASLLDLNEPAGKSVMAGLRGRIGEKDLSATQDYLEMFFLPSPPWHLLEEINPLSEVALASADGSVKHLVFTFAPVELSTGRRILGTVRDVTQAWELGRKLKEEEDRSARQMRHLFQIIQVKPELLLQFLQDADEEIATVNRRLKDPKAEPEALVEDLFQGIHAVKGNASLVGLTSFAGRVHDLEIKVAAFREHKPVWQDFLEMTVGLSLIQSELTELRELLGRMATFQRGIEASSGSRDLLILTLEKAVDRLRRDSGLEADLDVTSFHPGTIPEAHRKLTKDVLVQLVRNSFAHGLEPAEARAKAGKSARARIKVAAALRGGNLHLSFWDDGRGFDLPRLRKVSGESDNLGDKATLDLAFRHGLSTATDPGIHSGHGVGLALVKDRVENAGGVIKLRSVAGKGVAFDITLPIA